MQKEYEDIIRDEYKQNMKQGATSTAESFVNRRRTLMTLFNSQETSHTSATFNRIKADQTSTAKSVCLADDDRVSNTSKEYLNCSDMELTHIPNQPIMDQNDALKRIEMLRHSHFDKRKTISSSLFTSDDSSSTNLLPSGRSLMESLSKKLFITRSSSVISSDESVIYGRNTATNPKKSPNTETEMSELKLSSELNCAKASPIKESTDLSKTMSNLLLSLSPNDCSGRKPEEPKTSAGRNSSSISSLMPSLRLESEKENCVPEQSPLGTEFKLADKSSNETKSPPKSSSKKQKAKLTSNMNLPEDNSLIKSCRTPPETVKKSNKKQLSSDLGNERRFSLRQRNITYRRGNDFPSSDSSNDSIKNRIVKRIVDELESQDKLTSAHSFLTDDSEIISEKTVSKTASKSATVNTLKRSSREAASKTPGKVVKNKSVKNVTARKGVGLSPKANCVESLNDLSVEPKKTRKLYNPDNFLMQLDESVDDEEERQEKRNLVNKRNNGGNTINPFTLQPADNVDEVTESESENSPPKIQKITKKVQNLTLNQSADEQKDLLNYVLNKNAKTPKSQKTNGACIETPTPRRSIRLSNIRSTQKQVDVPMTPKNRRSTLDFVTSSEQSCKKSKRKVEKAKCCPTIVCTKLHKSQVQVQFYLILNTCAQLKPY